MNKVLHYTRAWSLVSDKHSRLLVPLLRYEENEMLWIQPQDFISKQSICVCDFNKILSSFFGRNKILDNHLPSFDRSKKTPLFVASSVSRTGECLTSKMGLRVNGYGGIVAEVENEPNLAEILWNIFSSSSMPWTNKLVRLSPSNLSSLVLTSMARRANPIGAPFKQSPSWICSYPYLQILDKAGKACLGQTF